MNDKKTTWITVLLILLILLLCIALLVSILPEDYNSSFNIIRENLSEAFVAGTTIFAVLCSAVVALYEIALKRKSQRQHEEKELLNPDIAKLNKLLEYSRKRAEIEEEIFRLTQVLSRSDVSEYLNLNHLIFAGQSSIVGNGTVNYNQFFRQFGIDKDSIQVKKGYAVFLTPFDHTSTKLYQTCSSILNGMSILLQRTDNIVDKNDIMMNIVSQIIRAEFLIVNIDGRNPNVYYELGIAHAIGKPTILISKTEYPDNSIGFDIRQKQIILYRDDAELEKELLYQINRIRDSQLS